MTDRIPTICPKYGHSVKFWRDDKGHMVSVPCDDPRLNRKENDMQVEAQGEVR